MSVDRLLTSVLRHYQDVHDDVQTEQIYGTTTTLLANLSNPLNITLLTSQLLTAPAIWGRRDGMRTCYRIISIYNTAAAHVRRYELENEKQKGGPRAGGGLSSNAWAAAVIKGADDQSSRWQHVLVLCGVLMGLENGGRRSLSRSMRNTLEQAVVTATNLALRPRGPEPPAPPGPVVLALNYAFPMLSDSSRNSLDCDALVPAATQAMLGADGLQDGLFLGAIDLDVRQAGQKFDWPETSPSFLHARQLEQRPLVSGLGPLSRLLTFSIERARDFNVVVHAQEDLLVFTEKLLQQWQANKLSELEISEEAVFLTAQTLRSTWPALWQLLKKIMYGIVAVLQSITARSLLDPRLRNDAMAPTVAITSLKILRNLYFVSSWNGSSEFQVYKFTYLTSIDNLARYPAGCESYLRVTKPPTSGTIPQHPLHRTLDLFYLNVAEHLPLNLPPEACDSLIVQPAIAYLTHAAPMSPRMMELFEAAHSAVLSVLSCPQNSTITVELAPFYAETLFKSFPLYISPRQFRIAFKTMMQILSPPYPIAATHPQLAETLLEMVRFRIPMAGKVPIPPAGPDAATATASNNSTPELLSEQCTLVMTLIDSLPFLNLYIFEDWLTLTALALNEVADVAMRESAKRRFWDVLSSGEMDVERAAIGVSWWGAKGGRETVLFGADPRGGHPPAQEMYMMSGAIVDDGERASKL
ncbi:putative PEX8 peroxisomal biogenesis factor 8 [Rhypophila decipiens]|uniref:PEX8 peroxisomal biogenesis factor 8 n=1 Tax=Rhypophila decipiens TaxID=261697 RepID=A0AAN6YJP8_9PEZI|nr:putative PEX8 peroxisomal biogenesis factor 8 [Rhypophila decipiens]